MPANYFTLNYFLTHQIRGRYYMTFFHLYPIIYD
jgi:hypothetical protein